jgi:hypothetical protein
LDSFIFPNPSCPFFSLSINILYNSFGKLWYIHQIFFNWFSNSWFQ